MTYRGVEICFASISKTVSHFFLFSPWFFLFFVFTPTEFTVTELCDDWSLSALREYLAFRCITWILFWLFWYFVVAVHMVYCRYGRVCCLVKLRISMIRTFSFGNISHITLYAHLEIVWKVSKVLRKYWGKYGQKLENCIYRYWNMVKIILRLCKFK